MGCGEGWGLYIYAVLEAPLSGASRHSLLRLATFPRGHECPCEKWSAAPVSPPCFVRWTRSAQLPPRGEPSVPASISAKFVVRQSCKKVHLTSKFSFTHGRKLGSPRGGTNSDRVQWTKQGAVSGAALRFLQAPAEARRKNRLSARGIGETPARAARLRGQQKSARLCGRLEGLYRFYKNVCRGRPALAVSTSPAAFGPGRPDGPAPRRGR